MRDAVADDVCLANKFKKDEEYAIQNRISVEA